MCADVLCVVGYRLSGLSIQSSKFESTMVAAITVKLIKLVWRTTVV